MIEVWPWENIVFVVNCGKLDRFNFNQSRGGGKRKKHIETVFQEMFWSDFIMYPKKFVML